MEMKKVIIHIGHIKTGSSALQDSFSENLDTLRNRKIFYPTRYATTTTRMDGVSIYEHNLLAAYDEDFQNIYKPLQKKYLSKPFLDKSINNFINGIEEDFLNGNFETLLLSSEFLSESTQRTIVTLKKWINSVLKISEIKLILYVRSPAEAYKSQMIQRVKSGLELTSPAGFFIDYKAIIQTFKNVYGNSSVIVLAYERDNFINNDIVEEFSDKFLGLKLKGKKINESLSLEAVLFLFKYWHDIGSKGKYGRSRFELLVPWLELNPYNSNVTSSPKLKAGLCELINYNHSHQFKFLADLGVNFNNTEMTMKAEKENYSRGHLIEQIFDSTPSERHMFLFANFVIDGLLNSCVVMNELLNSNHPQEPKG